MVRTDGLGKRCAAIVLTSVVMQAGALGPQAQAQTLVPDSGLSTQVGTDGSLRAFTVTRGSAQGSNLFHGFDTFSPGDWSVLFDLSGESFGSEIEQIFSRVTGTSASDINGSLSILGGNAPDLFLLNPNGILLGPNARLNLPGSFVGTTAESIQFADGSRFGTVTPTSGASLLSISVPTGLQFGQNPGAISVLGNGNNFIGIGTLAPRVQNPVIPPAGLSVTPGTTFALLGGPVRFNGAELQSPYQQIPGGVSIPNIPSIPIGQIQLEVGAVASGVVQLQEQAGGWSFDYSGIGNYRDIDITQQSLLNAGGIAPGRMNLWGRNITVDQGSTVTVYNWGGSPDSSLSGINIYASELLKVQGDLTIDANIATGAIAPQNFGFGPNQQDAGPINISSKNLQLLDGANINSTVFGIGNGGQLTIEVQENLVIDGETNPSRPVPRRTGIGANTFASGNVGNISIKTNNLLLDNGGSILSTSLSTGNAGRVDIDASGQVTLQEFNPLAQLPSTIASVSLREGNSGEGVFIRAKQLDLLDGGRISSSAFGSGDTGEIQLNILDSIRIGGSDSATSTEFSGIEAAVILRSVATDPFAEQNGRFGAVGSIEIQSPKLELFDGGFISVTNQGDGNAGNIKVLTDSLILSDSANVVATTFAGDGGNLNLIADESILLRRGSRLSVSSDSQGIGGNISIQTPYLVAFPQENSDITANATSADGGRIDITASSILGLSAQPRLTDQSDITASSELGPQFSGTIELNQADTNPIAGITTLPSNFANQDQTPLANACVEEGGTQFSRSGRGGLPRSPDNLLDDGLFLELEQDPINRAIALRRQGFYAQALALLEQEVAVLGADEMLERQAIAWRQLGITQELLEQYNASQRTLEQSLAISRALNNPDQISATLLSLGNLAGVQGDYSQARSLHQQALEQDPKARLKQRIMANQLSFALADGEQIAVKYIANLWLEELTSSVDNLQQLETQLNVAATLLRHQQSELIPNFLGFLQQNLEAAQAEGDPQVLAYALGHLGQAYEQSQQWENAQRFSEAALQLAQSRQDIFQEYQWAWQLGRIAGAEWEDSGDAQKRSQAQAAYQIAVQALQQLRGDLATVSPNLQFSFRNRVEPVYREYVSLLLPLPSHQTPTAIPAQDLQTALNTIEALKLAELDNFFQDACLQTTPRAIENLDRDAAVVYPIVLDDRIEVIFSHQGVLERHSVPVTPENFQLLIRDFRSSLVQRSRRDYQQLGEQLYDALIRPILSDRPKSQIQTLVFVPDKSLKNIPMSALFDGEEYLIEQFNVVVAPGLELLPGGSQATTQSKALLAGITKRHQGFPPLPYVRQEIEELQSLFPSEQLLDEGFTRETLTRSLRETETPIVHIATHGQFSSDASETFVLAWNEKIRLEELYELLQARDRESLTSTELLVLSACETAFGDEAAALGLAGVAVRAGARSTLASLWSVNDQSTALLMKTFYQQLSQGVANKSVALREAQLELLKHPSYRDPYYWSAFVLIGNWQ